MNDAALSKAIALVVDDHPETLRLIIDTLEHADVTVLVATDGARAVEQVKHVTPDVILLDAVMPGMDGFDTCRALKAGPAADVPVIFMTGLDDTEHVVRGFEAGGVDYLTKPIAPDELVARIRVHVANARSASGMRAALDVSGRTMLAVDAEGELRWMTPQAEQLLTWRVPSAAAGSTLSDELRAWITGSTGRPPAQTGDELLVGTGPDRLRFRLISRVSEREILLVVQQAAGEVIEREGAQRLQQRFSLTSREAEVLYWLCAGKANRDIADILGMSPRTTNKHLEHVYTKLGVESRSAAVARALPAMRG